MEGVWQKVGALACIDALLALMTGVEQLLAARVEGAMQIGEERDGRRGEDGGVGVGDRRENLDSWLADGHGHGAASERRENRVQDNCRGCGLLHDMARMADGR